MKRSKMINNRKNRVIDKNVKKRKLAFNKITTIRFKLIVPFFIPIIFLILLGAVSYQKASEGIRTSYQDANLQTIRMTSKYLQFGIDEIHALATQYQNDDTIKNYLLGVSSNDVLQNSKNYKAIQNSIITKETTVDYISDIYILSDKYNSISTTSSIAENMCAEFLQTESGKLIRNMNDMIWVGSNTFLDEKLGVGMDEYSLRLIRFAVDKESLIVIDMDHAMVQNILSDVEISKDGMIALVTSDGKEIVSSNSTANPSSVFTNQEFYKKALNSDITDGAVYVDYQKQSNLFLYSKIGDTGAMICALIPKSLIYSQADSIKEVTLFLGTFACIIAILVGLFISGGIDKTIKYIIAKLKKAADGDIAISFNTKRNDEFRILMDELNHTFLNVKGLIGQVTEMGNNVSNMSDNVAITAQDFAQETANIALAMNEIEQGVMQEAKDAEQCLEQMDNLSKKIEIMSTNTCKIETITDETKKSILEGTITTNELNEQTKSTNEITSVIVREIENLAEKSKSIDVIVNVITNIISQTNLLSLNASIEAARAGEAGKGFSVVASEMRSLSEQTQMSINNIKSIIKTLQENMIMVASTAKKAEEVMQLQSKAVQNTTKSYSHINESVDDLVIHLKNIVSNVQSIEDARVNTLTAIENISSVLEEIAAYTINVNQTATKQLVSSEQLKQWSVDLNKDSEKLVNAIHKFNV